MVYSCFFVYLFTSTALRGTGDNNETGFHDSPSFQLDTHDPNPMDSIGFADSGGFELNTGGDDGTLQTGIGDTGGFALNTQDSSGGNGDMNNTGFADSGGFQLDTSDGNSTSSDSNQTGFANSGGFDLDTRNPNPMDNIGFADSGGFELDTGGDDGTETTGFSDSNGFSLDTIDDIGSVSDQNNTGFADSGSFDLNTTDFGNQQNQSNNPPYFQSDGNLSVQENQTFVFEFYATDPEFDALSYSIIGGNDQTLFDINFSTGTLSFITPKDFEAPEDENLDNTYQLTIEVTDRGTPVPLNLNIQVTDIIEADFYSFGPFQIEESRPVGSMVGQFRALNIEPTQSFSYSVLSLNEDPLQIQDRILELKALSQGFANSPEEIDAYQMEITELQERIELIKSNGLFFVDQNGTLRTNQMLKYEAFSEHPYFTILVQATDKHNLTLTKQFMVDLLEVELEPENTLPAIVRTINPTDNSETRYLLQGEILTDGGSVIVETGFWVSKSIRFRDPIRLTSLIDPQTGLFHAEFVEFEPGTRYYYRSFAVNNYGESKGSIKKFKTPEMVDPFAWWKDTEEVGGGWR